MIDCPSIDYCHNYFAMKSINLPRKRQQLEPLARMFRRVVHRRQVSVVLSQNGQTIVVSLPYQLTVEEMTKLAGMVEELVGLGPDALREAVDRFYQSESGRLWTD